MDLIASFDAEIRNLNIKTLKETSYRPSHFMQMVKDRGGFDSTVVLIRASSPSDGFTKLWELKRLDLTVEAVALEPKFSSIFTEDDLLKARKRLDAYGYRPGENA